MRRSTRVGTGPATRSTMLTTAAAATPRAGSPGFHAPAGAMGLISAVVLRVRLVLLAMLASR
ncbi:hypothetical protein GCM10009613_35940 [Pseudonocardia kongjuensis]|uniref:Uncharacterized protein n=1 Tax=Pseudonocardia kongjuensis TaxID=102227 RepID=A0ABP4IML4_9PSEU